MSDREAPTVLIIEDDEELRAMIAYALTLEGYRTLSAAQGIEGLESARSLHPDVILLDMMMPGLSGADVLAELQEREDTRCIPVIICSAVADRATKKLRIEGGADDYLTKPFDLDDLLLRLLVALRRAP